MADDTNVKVASILEKINKDQDDVQKKPSVEKPKTKAKKQKVVQKVETVRGMPKSGRFWKSTKEKFTTMNATKGLSQNFEQKTALRLELQRTKELSKQVQEEIKLREVQRKERRRENIKKTEENKRKAEVVQVITNTAKLKRLRKKQLRFIEKRDTTKVDNSK